MQSENGIVGREFVLRVLQENGVSISPQKGTAQGHLVLVKGEILEVRVLEQEVGRRMVRALSLKFSIPIHLFYA